MKENQNLNLTQLSRISMLLAYLKRKPYRTKQEILGYFKDNDKAFNERTFYRLKETLTVDFAIEINFDYSNGGYFFDEENSVNADSFLSLLEVLVTAELFTTNFNDKTTALNYIEFENKAAIQSIPNFKIIFEAIKQCCQITFDHYSYYHLKEQRYNLKPYFLKQYQNRWYVVGETEKGYRTFGIDRMQNIIVTDKKFKTKTEDAKEIFNQVIGLNYSDHKLE